MRTYYLSSPRGFANEYDLFSVLPEHLDEFRAARPHRRLTRKDAESLAASNRRAYRRGEASHQHPAGATEIEPWETSYYRLHNVSA